MEAASAQMAADANIASAGDGEELGSFLDNLMSDLDSPVQPAAAQQEDRGETGRSGGATSAGGTAREGADSLTNPEGENEVTTKSSETNLERMQAANEHRDEDSAEDDSSEEDVATCDIDSFASLGVPGSRSPGGDNQNRLFSPSSSVQQRDSSSQRHRGLSTPSTQLALLVPFVPRLVLQMYDSSNPQLPTGPMHTVLDAAVGLFDVSGFSKIADRLEKEEAHAGGATALESEGVALRRKASLMPDQARSSSRMGSKKQSNVNDSLNRSAGRLRTLVGVSMMLGGGGGGERTNLKKGSAAERLTNYLNYILGILTDTVETHGGDILKFAGDAIIVCWTPTRELGVEPQIYKSGSAQPEQLEIPCIRAVLCARDAMTACTDKLLNSGDPVMSSLGLHIGLGASKVLAGHVGGIENRWEFFITGKACEEMNQSEKDANNMEIVFSSSMGEWIRRFKGRNGSGVELATVRLESGNERLVFVQCPPSDLPDVMRPVVLKNAAMSDVLKMYIPQPVKINLKDGIIETAGGLRKMTVVFMELLDIDVTVSDDKYALDEVNQTVRKIQEAVCHFDATLRQFIVDDKGTVAIVVFGLPPIYHEDNAARGVNLGLRLLRQGVQAKIGVTTGTAFAGIIGNPSRQEYAAVGDVVNMSARLMGNAARNTVLCDESTVKEAEDVLSFKQAMRIKVKGKEELLAVFEPAASGGVGVRQTNATKAFLDRGDHAEGLQELLANAHIPVGIKTALIEGERGSGKSVLLSKAVGMMDGREIHTFCSAGDMHERHTSLFPFRQVLCQLLEIDQDLINWYGGGNRNKPNAAPRARRGSTATATVTAGQAPVDQTATTIPEGAGEGARGFVVAGGAGGVDSNASPDVGGGGGLESLFAQASTPAISPPAHRKRSSWGANLPGRRRSVESRVQQASLHLYEPTAFKGKIVNNPGFLSLMQDPELSKYLPLLNMILPLYNEQAVGAVTTAAHDTHAKLRRLTDMIAALLVHRLEATKKVPTSPPEMKDASVVVTPAAVSRRRRSSTTSLRISILGDVKQASPPSPESKGCRAALVFDNAQWLDHNTWELMLLLRKVLPGMLLVVAFRPSTDMHNKRTIPVNTVPGSLKMNMGRLTATQVMLLLAQNFGVQRTNEQLLEFLEVTTMGNPRDTIHMMEDLLKEEIVEVDHNLGAVVILKELSENSLKIKDHTSAPIIAKYDKLGRSTQQLVQAAAVIGQEVPLELLVDMYSLIPGAPGSKNQNRPLSASSNESSYNSDSGSGTASAPQTASSTNRSFGENIGAGGGDVEGHINKLVRVGLLERSSSESVRFVAKYMVTIIYDMILHSKRVDMHKEIVFWYVTHKTFADLRPHFRFLGKHAMAAGDQDLGVKFFVMAAEVAISCGDPTEAQLACSAVTQAVDDSASAGHLTLFDQVLRETKLHLLVGQTAILSQDWESADMSLQLAVDMSGVNTSKKHNFYEKLVPRWLGKLEHGWGRWVDADNAISRGSGEMSGIRAQQERAERSDQRIRRSLSQVSDQSSASTTNGEAPLDLDGVERYGAGGVMLKKYGNDAKILLKRLEKYQALTRSFHNDLLADNRKIVEEHNKMFVASAGVLCASNRTDPGVLPWHLRGNAPAAIEPNPKQGKKRVSLIKPPPPIRVSMAGKPAGGVSGGVASSRGGGDGGSGSSAIDAATGRRSQIYRPQVERQALGMKGASDRILPVS